MAAVIDKNRLLKVDFADGCSSVIALTLPILMLLCVALVEKELVLERVVFFVITVMLAVLK